MPKRSLTHPILIKALYRLMATSALALVSANTLAVVPSCSYSNFQIPSPQISLMLTSNTYPQMASSSWHYSGLLKAFTCSYSSALSNRSTASVVNNLIPNTGKQMIYEGLTYDIYDTGVKGLGLIMTAQDASQRYVPFTSNEIKTVTAVAPAAFSSYPWSRSSQFAIRYVLTERPAVGSLSIPGQSIMRHGILTELDGYNGWGTVTTLPGKLQTSYPSCTVQAPSTVALPRLDASYLQSPGQYYDAYQLKLTVSCFPGVNASYTMTDISNEANRSSVLTLAPGGTAQGVSFQLADNNEPVSYGPALSIQGNINQRFFGVIPDDGLLSKSLDVRYIRTAGPLTPGTLRAGATITMSYN